MSERNKITISPVQGESVLYINGFKISIVSLAVKPAGYSDVIAYKVHRKGECLKTCSTLQQAVHWCED